MAGYYTTREEDYDFDTNSYHITHPLKLSVSQETRLKDKVFNFLTLELDADLDTKQEFLDLVPKMFLDFLVDLDIPSQNMLELAIRDYMFIDRVEERHICLEEFLDLKPIIIGVEDYNEDSDIQVRDFEKVVLAEYATFLGNKLKQEKVNRKNNSNEWVFIVISAMVVGYLIYK